MNSILDIRVQYLFFITLVLKVGSSFLGWMFQDPWILGFTMPLLIMVAYIVLGYFRRDNEVTDEKFADTCYYLGFIFTITSIIFSLLDLPQIGTKIQDIAVRFGTAMVSTVFGLAVRVYLVSFKKDAADAVKDAEEAVLDTTRKFTEQLTVALERLRDFETQVDTAAKTSVERVNLQVENLSKNHADKLTAFFADLTNRNQEAFTSALTEVKSASQKLAESVDSYSLGMRSNLGSIEARVGAFTDAVTARLKTTTFPDDYFAQHLSNPLSQLKESSAALAVGIKGSLQEVTESTKVLSSALKKLRDKAGATEDSLETVLRLAQHQQAVLDAAQGQVTSLGHLGNTLKTLDETLATTVAGIVSSNGLTSELTVRVGEIVADGAETRNVLKVAMNGVTETLKAQAQATSTMVASLDAGTVAKKELAHSLAGKIDASTVAAESASRALIAATSASTVVVEKLDAVAVADMKAVHSLDALGRQATTALGHVDGAVEQLQGMVRQLTTLDATLRARGADSNLVEPRPLSDVGGLLPASTAPGTAASSLSQPLTAFQPTSRNPQPQSSQGALSSEQATAPAQAHSVPPVAAPAGLGSTTPIPGNSAGHGLPATGSTVAGTRPAAPQIQVPIPGIRLADPSVGSTPPAPQQPPST